jgi:hypothetical protein
MKNRSISRIVLMAALLLIIPTLGNCGSKLEGTYTNNGGMVTLDLKGGGKAMWTMMGETTPCKYTVKGEKIALDCTPKGEKLDLMIHDDGSLTGPGFIGSMKKSK